MSGGFNDPIIGGGGALVYPAIHSPNFVHNSAGWSINKDGSAEFNNLTIRNGTVISGVFLLYSSAVPAKGNLVAAFAPITGGTDSVGNVYPQGFTFGTWNASGVFTSGTHLDTAGNISLSDATPVTRLYETPGNGAIVCYDPTGQAAGHHLASVAANAFTDPAGNVIQRGVTAYGLSNPATQYAQLIGAALEFFDTVNAATAPGLIGLNSSGVVGSDDSLEILSPLSGASDVQSSLLLIRAAAGGTALVQIGNAALNIKTSTTPPQPSGAAGGFFLHADANGYPRVKVPLAGDTNDYFVVRTHERVSPRSQTINSLNPIGVNNLSIAVGIGTYFARARLIIEWTATAGTPQMRFAGPAISQFDVSFKSQQSGSASTTNDANLVSAGTGSGTGYNGASLVSVTGAMTTNGIFFDLDIWGMFTFTAAGTLTLQAQTTSSTLNTWIVLSGFWEVWPDL